MAIQGVSTTENQMPFTQVMRGMKPGMALDYAMGDGRNSLYLAKLGL
jgi:hypothetical protein